MKSKILFCKLYFVMMAFAPLPATAINNDLLEMSEQLDRIDKQDFQDAIERAISCTRKRDFSCAEAELGKAAKVANDGKDKRILLASRQSLADEKQELANEKRRAEEARRREEEERERELEREEQRRRAEEQEQQDQENTNLLKGLAAIAVGAHVGYSARGYSPEQKDKLVKSAMRGVMNGNSDEFNNTTNQVLAEKKQQHNEKMTEIERARKGQEGSETERRRNAEPERARAQSTPSLNIDNSWQTCGPGKKIAMLSGVREYGPYQPSRPMCESECVMPSGAFYHDTDLPNDRVYIGSGRKCNTPCNINYSCG
jgi:hypothetical protein